MSSLYFSFAYSLFLGVCKEIGYLKSLICSFKFENKFSFSFRLKDSNFSYWFNSQGKTG